VYASRDQLGKDKLYTDTMVVSYNANTDLNASNEREKAYVSPILALPTVQTDLLMSSDIVSGTDIEYHEVELEEDAHFVDVLYDEYGNITKR
jgi:hypothetical protein